MSMMLKQRKEQILSYAIHWQGKVENIRIQMKLRT